MLLNLMRLRTPVRLDQVPSPDEAVAAGEEDNLSGEGSWGWNLDELQDRVSPKTLCCSACCCAMQSALYACIPPSAGLIFWR